MCQQASKQLLLRDWCNGSSSRQIVSRTKQPVGHLGSFRLTVLVSVHVTKSCRQAPSPSMYILRVERTLVWYITLICHVKSVAILSPSTCASPAACFVQVSLSKQNHDFKSKLSTWADRSISAADQTGLTRLGRPDWNQGCFATVSFAQHHNTRPSCESHTLSSEIGLPAKMMILCR